MIKSQGTRFLWVTVLLGLVVFNVACTSSPEKQPPNILVIICDQLNADALACYGGPVSTPNIDRLARKGLVFNDAVCTTPVCSPSRASLVLGVYPHEHGIIHNCMIHDYPAIAADRPKTEEGITNADLTIDRLLNENGYQCYQFGKWHLSGEKLDYFKTGYAEHHEYALEMAQVFEKVKKLPKETWMDWYGWILPVKQTSSFLEAASRTSPEFRASQYLDFVTKIGKLEIPAEKNFDVRVADQSIEAIQHMDDSPFMLTCSFNYPHDPNVVPDPYYSMFDPDSIELPVNYDINDDYYLKSWSSTVVRELGETGVREFLRTYYASVKLIDDQVGRVLDALEESGKSENTIVVFTADHGDMMGSHKMIWKSNHSFYDEVVRIPMIVSYPGKIEPWEAQFPISITDIPTSLLALSGHEVPGQMTGNDLSVFMTGKSKSAEAPQYVLCERMYTHPSHIREVEAGRKGQFMIRGRGWKYAVYTSGKEFLFDLKTDPEELVNLADDPGYLDEKAALQEELKILLERTNYR